MTVVYINAVQYQTCPNHESDNHFFAKIPGGVPTPGPPSGSALVTNLNKQINIYVKYCKYLLKTR